MVRSTPTSPYSMMCAAAIPVSSEICAFQPSTGSGARNSSRQPGSPSRAGSSTISCSGICRLAPPRSASRCSRHGPTSASRAERLPWRAAVDLGLGLDVAELRATADQRPADLRAGHLAPVVQPDGPQQRRPNLVGQQAGRPLTEHRRVQRGPVIGGVQGHATAVGLQVDRVAGANERRHVGDRVGDQEAGSVAGDVYGLVQIARPFRVDRDQLDVCPVPVGQPGLGRRLLGRGQDLGGKGVGHLEVGPDGRQSGGQVGRKLVRQADLARRHSARLPANRPDEGGLGSPEQERGACA